VLAGTALTALIGYYIFPYGWSFSLAMTFGSILSATDPVAVAALLEQVGAPPRLKVHIVRSHQLGEFSELLVAASCRMFCSICPHTMVLSLDVLRHGVRRPVKRY